MSNHALNAGAWVGVKPALKKVGPSDAAEAAEILGAIQHDPALLAAPSVGRFLNNIGATVGGAVESPLHPLDARARRLARMDRGFDVVLTNGGKLSVLEAMSNEHIVRLVPPSSTRQPSITIGLPMEGEEERAVVQTTPHSPYAPVGFYNATEALVAVQAVRRVLTAVGDADWVNKVDQFRALDLLDRLDVLSGFLRKMAQSTIDRPTLRLFRDAQLMAYQAKKENDPADLRYCKVMNELKDYLDKGAGGLDPELLERAKTDLATLAKDRDKWLTWRKSTGLFTLWVPSDY